MTLKQKYLKLAVTDRLAIKQYTASQHKAILFVDAKFSIMNTRDNTYKTENNHFMKTPPIKKNE